ncbi:hypothetical protein CRUP_024534 [Coryphaenoides rupestris]|nr:hypothetical protein CRUP_024534 [Coryphaenoides rupestris]
MERSLRCVSADGQQVTRCSPDTMPERRKVCSNLDCEYRKHLSLTWKGQPLATASSLINSGLSAATPQHTKTCGGKNVGSDILTGLLARSSGWTGGYFKRNQITCVYCAGLQTDTPQEYLSLTAGERENFSEVFGFRLMDPSQCPANSSSREDSTDWQFASTHEGQPVPFATAGDCFSAARCPQVKPAGQSQRGQPCNVCGAQCPGFSLHPWRAVKPDYRSVPRDMGTPSSHGDRLPLQTWGPSPPSDMGTVSPSRHGDRLPLQTRGPSPPPDTGTVSPSRHGGL